MGIFLYVYKKINYDWVMKANNSYTHCLAFTIYLLSTSSSRFKPFIITSPDLIIDGASIVGLKFSSGLWSHMVFGFWPTAYIVKIDTTLFHFPYIFLITLIAEVWLQYYKYSYIPVISILFLCTQTAQVHRLLLTTSLPFSLWMSSSSWDQYAVGWFLYLSTLFGPW